MGRDVLSDLAVAKSVFPSDVLIEHLASFRKSPLRTVFVLPASTRWNCSTMCRTSSGRRTAASLVGTHVPANKFALLFVCSALKKNGRKIYALFLSCPAVVSSPLSLKTCMYRHQMNVTNEYKYHRNIIESVSYDNSSAL